jgi:hypothetical protein
LFQNANARIESSMDAKMSMWDAYVSN